VRNCEEYIKETIDSIRAQEFPHESMEMVIVDDGSDDNTLAIVKHCISKTDIPTKVFHTSWRGLGHARNIVIANAKGDFILWVDGDMILSQGYVRKLIEVMDQHPEIGIAKGKQALIPGANLLATLEAYSRAAGRMVDYTSDKGRFKALGTGGAIYRTCIFRQVGGFDENLRGYGEDWDMEIRARAAGWLLCTVDAYFLDYERLGLCWKNLWRRYWLRGYYTHFFLHKNKGMLKHYRMFPPAAFLSGLLHALTLYKLTRQKIVFMLPFQSIFKMTAWYVGFINSHLNSYTLIYNKS